VAELAAVLHGKPKDELVGEDVRQHKFAMRLLRVGVSALSVLTMLTLVFAIIAYIQLGVAREQRQTAISRAVAAQSVTLRPKSPSKSMLAAVAAWRLAPTTEARSALLDAQVQQFSGQLIGHTDMVTTTAVNADGRIIATGSLDKTVRLWNTSRHVLIGILKGHNGAVRGVAFHPTKPNLLVSVSSDGSIRWWDIDQRIALAVTAGHRDQIFGVAFSRDGWLLATASNDRTIRLWDTESRTPIGDALTGHTAAVTNVALVLMAASLLPAATMARHDCGTSSRDAISRLWPATAIS
jgi:WD40 repeat protein